MSTPKRWSNGSASMNSCNPLALRQRALSVLGRDDNTSRVTGICGERCAIVKLDVPHWDAMVYV